jgi:hypothetical protein
VSKAITAARQRGDRAAVRRLRQRQRSLPSRDPHDPRYRRLRYCRYAHDTLLGFTGPKAEAEEIKARLAAFLRDDLKLELSQDKTLITHGRTHPARFLGYEIIVQHNDRQIFGGFRAANANIALRVPQEVVKAKSAPYLTHGKPGHRPQRTGDDDHTIVAAYGAEYRGIVQCYLLAGDVWRLNRLEWVMKTSMLKTLAAKHRSTVSKIARKHQVTIATPHGPRRCFEARIERPGRTALVARFGGIPLKRHKRAVLSDPLPYLVIIRRKELLSRLQRGQCEACGQVGPVEIHHVRQLADLTRPAKPQPAWAQAMAKRRATATRALSLPRGLTIRR